MGREFLSKSFWSWMVELLKAFRVLIPCSDTEKMEALENGRQAIWANTESHQSERPQLLHFLAAAVCSQAFFLPLWGSPTRLSAAQPFQTEQNEATQRFTMWPDLPGLSWGGMNLPSTFMVAEWDWGRGNPRKRELGEWERGSAWECGRAKKISLCHPTLCYFKAELHRFLWFLLSLFFYKSGKKL